MRTTTPDGLWIETRGALAEIGLVTADRGGKPLTRVETVGRGSRLRKGGAFLLLTFGKGKAAQEVEVDAPVEGKITEIEPAVAKAVTGVAAILAAPASTWVVRVELTGAVEEEEDDDEDGLDDDLDDCDDDDDA